MTTEEQIQERFWAEVKERIAELPFKVQMIRSTKAYEEVPHYLGKYASVLVNEDFVSPPPKQKIRNKVYAVNSQTFDYESLGHPLVDVFMAKIITKAYEKFEGKPTGNHDVMVILRLNIGAERDNDFDPDVIKYRGMIYFATSKLSAWKDNEEIEREYLN